MGATLPLPGKVPVIQCLSVHFEVLRQYPLKTPSGRYRQQVTIILKCGQTGPFTMHFAAIDGASRKHYRTAGAMIGSWVPLIATVRPNSVVTIMAVCFQLAPRLF